ncbi:MAG: GNAT family N-acetyltransferase [Planctomycetia bacterium]|nr:GNAT family N-acetyltransferase [Planctomycetia bacterium]
MPSRNPAKRLIASVKKVKADHAERRRTTGFEFAIADRIDLLSSRHWDAVTDEATFFLQRDYLNMFEQHGPREIAPRYCLIAEEGQPVAAVAAQMVVLEGGQLIAHPGSTHLEKEGEGKSKKLSAVPKGMLTKLGRSTLRHVRRRVLVCGNLLSWGAHGVAFAAGEDAARLWPAVAEALYRIRNAEKLFGKTDYVMVKDIPDSLAGGASQLRKFSYRPTATDPDMVLDLPSSWRGYDDYLSSLNSRYRKTAKALDKDVVKAGLRLESLTDLSSEADAIYRLYRQVHDRASVRLATLPAEYLPALAAAAGADHFRCTVIRRGDEMVGFVTTLKDGETAIGYYIGFDYATNADAPLYLRLLQAVVADGISLDCRRLSFGRTALEPKARLGAKPEPMSVWMRHRQPLLNLIVRPLLSAIPHDEPPQRNAFKETAGQ